jgi:hypothetical protein
MRFKELTMKSAKLLSLVTFYLIYLGLHSFPVHAELIDTNGDGYPDFDCPAPMSLPDGSVGCGDNSTSSPSPVEPNNNSDSSCFQTYGQCVDQASSNPSTLGTFTEGLDCAVGLVGCVGKEIRN